MPHFSRGLRRTFAFGAWFVLWLASGTAVAEIRIDIDGVDGALQRNVEALLSVERYKDRDRIEPDAVQRLYDVQIPQPPPPTGTRTARVSEGRVGSHPAGQSARYRPVSRSSDAGKYVRLGPLGRAIRQAAEREQRSVVLIDEIDKADIDFPNDLLRELDQLAFDVPEVPGLGYAVPEEKPQLRPVVIG